MSPLARTMLVALAGVVLLVPAIGVAAVRGDPPVTTPVETVPPPPDPAPPVEPVVTLEPTPPITITIEVPALPEPAVAAPKRKLGQVVRPRAVRPRADARRVSPTRVERESRSRADVAPVAKKKATPKAKLKPKQKQKLSKPQRRVIAPVSAPRRPIRDRTPAQGVLAAQFSASPAASPATTHRAVLYLALALAAVLGTLFGLVGAAPVLAGRWPQVFVPVIDATEQIVLAGVCLAGAALTLAVTWALTGPGP